MQERQVVKVQEVQEVGSWAPLTSEGTLLVDGILASCYASFPHTLSDLILSPVKALSTLLLDDDNSQHRDGTRAVVDLVKRAGSMVGMRRKVEKKTLDLSLARMAQINSAIHTEL